MRTESITIITDAVLDIIAPVDQQARAFEEAKLKAICEDIQKEEGKDTRIMDIFNDDKPSQLEARA